MLLLEGMDDVDKARDVLDRLYMLTYLPLNLVSFFFPFHSFFWKVYFGGRVVSVFRFCSSFLGGVVWWECTFFVRNGWTLCSLEW